MTDARIEHSTDIITIRGQRFARFGRYLADLTPFSYVAPRRGEITCTPLADSEGRYTATFPDEGQSTLECEFRRDDGRTHVGGGPFRWILWEERNLTNRDIAEHTSDMMDDGSIPPQV